MNWRETLISCSWHPNIPGKSDYTPPLRQQHSTQLLAKLQTKKPRESERGGREREREREWERGEK